MKKFIFALLMLILSLVLFCSPFMLLAGQSDKALQTLVINGPDLLGFGAEENTEDSKFAAECSNLYPSSNGLSTIYNNYFGPVTGETFFDGKMVNEEIIYNSSSSILGSKTILYRSGQDMIPSVYSGGSFLFAFGFYKSGAYYYAMNSSVMFKALYGAAAPTQVTGLPFYSGTYSASSAAIWKNRLWVSSSNSATPNLRNRIFVSSPTDWENFSTGTSATDGFVQDMPDYVNVIKLVSNLTGIYVICSDAIYLISGGDSPETWRTERVAVFNQVGSVRQIITFKNSIILNDGKDFYILEGYTLQKLCSFPYSDFNLTACAMWADRYFVMSSTPLVNSVIYDTQTKTYFEFSPILGLVENNYWVKSDLWFQLPPVFKQNNLNQITPFTYKTSWLTLDGNPANFKEIVRIEIDSLLDSTASVEIGLGLSTKTGEEYFKKIIPGKTYSESIKGTRPPTNTYTWNVGMRKAVRRIYIKWAYNAGTIGATSFLKQIRIYYRNVGNIKSNEVR